MFVAILVPYFETLGLKPSDNYLIQAAFAATMLVLEVPTGYFSDVVGRKTALICAALIYPISGLFYLFSGGFWGFVVAEALGAVAMCLRSGTDSALMYDTLLQLGREKEHKKIEGNAFFLQQIGTTLAHVLGGLLYTLWIKLPFVLNMVVSCLFLPLALSMQEPKREKEAPKSMRNHGRELIRAVKYCATHSTIRNAVLYISVVSGLNLIGFWSYYIYYGKLGIAVGLFGFIAASASLLAGFGGKLLHRIEKRWGMRIAYLLPLLTALSYLLMGAINAKWVIVFVFVNHFFWGFSYTLLRDTMHRHTRSNIRATVLSVGSMGARLTYIVMAFFMGGFVDRFGVQAGLMLLGALFALGAALPAWNLSRATEGKE